MRCRQIESGPRSACHSSLCLQILAASPHILIRNVSVSHRPSLFICWPSPSFTQLYVHVLIFLNIESRWFYCWRRQCKSSCPSKRVFFGAYRWHCSHCSYHAKEIPASAPATRTANDCRGGKEWGSRCRGALYTNTACSLRKNSRGRRWLHSHARTTLSKKGENLYS